jgi:DnaJ-class molecular chaperone
MKFDKAFEHLIINEGVYSNDPMDKGGKTIYGIASSYHPEDFNLVYNLYVPITKVILGGKCKVPTLDGEVNITINPHTKIGDTLRLRGKGYPGGDMFVKLNVRFERPI